MSQKTLDEIINEAVEVAKTRLDSGAILAPKGYATVSDVNLLLLWKIWERLSQGQAKAPSKEPAEPEEKTQPVVKKRGRKKK